jgi:hypothetical protein
MDEPLTREKIDQAQEITSKDIFDEDDYLTELARLSPAKYDQRRRRAAARLKMRLSGHWFSLMGIAKFRGFAGKLG